MQVEHIRKTNGDDWSRALGCATRGAAIKMIHILQKRSRAAAENKTPGCYRKQENEIVEDQQCSDASHLRAPPAKIFEMGAECGIQAPPSSQLSSFSPHFSNIFACRCTSASSTLCRNFRGDIVEMWFNSPSNECGLFS
jgi:hypothetical protein